MSGNKGEGLATAWLVRAYNPAFDVTPARLITAIITDLGIIRPVNELEITRIIGGETRPSGMRNRK